jgi:tryptophanyl-tRNA synthetase
MDALAARYVNKGSSDFKRDVAEAVIEGWRHPRDELAKLRADRGYLTQVLEDGGRRARDLSSVTLRGVRKLIGLSDVDLLRYNVEP